MLAQQLQAQVVGKYDVVRGPHWTEKNYISQPPNPSKDVMQIDHIRQCEQTYSGDQLGNCTDETICSAGCAMTCMTMILNTNGVDVDSGQLNTWLVDNNGYTSDGCLIYWDVARGYPGSTVTFAGSADYSLNIIRQNIDAGNPVIAYVDNGGHFVVISGYNNAGTQASDFLVKDPGRADGDNRNWSNYVDGVVDLRIFHNVGYVWSYSISGNVLDENYNGLNGVTIQFNNGAGETTTSSTGFYTQEVNTDWSGTAIPLLAEYDFTPQFRTYDNLTESLTNQFYNSTKIPVADFSYSGVYGDFPLGVTFTDESAENPTSWYWEFGDGTTSDIQDPTHSYIEPGTYLVSLTVSKGGTPHSITKSVTVTDQLHAAISVSPTSGAFPLTVNFTDESAGNPTGWLWSFGDGGSSTGQNPSHTYNSTGNYKVKLTVTKDAYTDATDGTFTIVVNDPVFFIKGQILPVDGFYGIPGLRVEAINSSDGAITDIDDTDSQGNYELWVPYEWTGKVYVYGGTLYADNWLNFGTPITSNQTNKDMLLEQVTLDIIQTQKPNLFFEFKVQGTPWGTLYEWDMNNDGMNEYEYSTHLSVVNHQYQCEIGSNKYYTVNLKVTAGGKIHSVLESVFVPACSHVNSALAFSETDCNVFGMWGNYTSSASTIISKIEDLSYPISDVYRVIINWKRDRIYDSEDCEIGDCKDKGHDIFDNNCRVFDDFQSYTVGHYSISLSAYDKNLVNHNIAEIEFDVVNCSLTSNSENLQESFHYTSNGISKYFNGNYEISNLYDIPDYLNKNLEFNACSKITLNQGFRLAASANNSAKFLINSCLQENNSKDYLNSSIPYSDIYMAELQVEADTINEKNVVTKINNIVSTGEKVIIYPNPTSDIVNIDLTNNILKVNRIIITNIKGEVIFIYNENIDNIIEVNLANKPSGIYIVRIELINTIENFKVIKL